MFDEEKLEGVRAVIILFTLLLMVAAVILQLVAFETVLHTILCSCIVLLVTATLIIDGLLKDLTDLIIHGGWLVIWFGNLILNLL